MTDRESMILQYQPLAKMVARLYDKRGVGGSAAGEDLKQEALVGLIEAVDEYQAKPADARYKSFEAFATYRIRLHLEKSLARGENGSMSMGRDTFVKRGRVERAREKLSRAGHRPTRAELSEATGISERTIEELSYAARMGVGDNQQPTFGNGGNDAPSDLCDASRLRLENIPAEEANDTHSGDLEKLLAVVDRLPPRQRDIIQRRYGLRGRKGGTMLEVAKAIGCGKSNVKYHEDAAMETLRRELGVK